MLLFVSCLLQHGLVYGGMKAVDSTLSLRQMYQVFLVGGEAKPWGPSPTPWGSRVIFPRRNTTTTSPPVRSFREQHPHLPFAPPLEDVATDSPSTMDDRRLANVRLTHDVRLRNPYVAQPIFDNRCGFCSTKSCSRFVAGTTLLNCKKYREQVLFAPTRQICDYRRCLAPHEHHTVTCPYIHKKCSKCGSRGHDTVDGCDLRNSAIMSRLKSDFEEWANCGLYTRKRFDAIEWGFYGVPSFQPPSNFFSYRHLTDLPVLGAMAFLQTLLLLPEYVAASGEFAPQSPAPSDGSASDGSPDQPKRYPTC